MPNGCLTTTECMQKSQTAGITCLFNHFGIPEADMNSGNVNNFDSMAVRGQVFRNGVVKVNGQTVATGAITAGRRPSANDSALIRCGNVTFYQRLPSASFTSSPLAAFVVMKNNRFAYAIIASCGNPIMATPVTPVVTRTTPTPTPPPVVVVTPPPQVISAATPPPAPAPAPSPAPAAQQPTQIGKFGPGNVFGVGSLATVVGTLGHYFYKRRLF